MADYINLHDCEALTKFERVDPNFIRCVNKRIEMVTKAIWTDVGYIFMTYFNVYNDNQLVTTGGRMLSTLDKAVKIYNSLP